MKRLLPFLIVLSASPVFFQGFEATALAGYTTPGALEHAALGITELKLDGSFTWGASAAYFFSPRFGLEASWARQESGLVIGTAAGPPLDLAAPLKDDGRTPARPSFERHHDLDGLPALLDRPPEVMSGGSELKRNQPFVTTIERPRSTLRALAAAALFCLVAGAAMAQTAKDSLELTRQAVETQRRVLVAGALPLTEAEADAFWPLYDAYEKARRPLDERANKLVADFLASSANLTDAKAKAMVEEVLEIEEGRLRVRRDYLGRMVKAIPARKVARFYQIDNKLDAIVRADVSRQIPLTP